MPAGGSGGGETTVTKVLVTFAGGECFDLGGGFHDAIEYIYGSLRGAFYGALAFVMAPLSAPLRSSKDNYLEATHDVQTHQDFYGACAPGDFCAAGVGGVEVGGLRKR